MNFNDFNHPIIGPKKLLMRSAYYYFDFEIVKQPCTICVLLMIYVFHVSL